MNLTRLLAVIAAGSLVAACDSGDINIAPVNNTDNSIGDGNTIGGGGAVNPDDICASYQNAAGQEFRGSADAQGNCVYDANFVGPQNELLVDLFLPRLEDDAGNTRAHIFSTPIIVGKSYKTIAEANAAGIFQGGDGPALRIEAGAIIALQSSKDFIAINRGSRIIANGTADRPITITSVSDISDNLGADGPEAVQQIGGMVINGFGVSSECSYTDLAGNPRARPAADAPQADKDDFRVAEGDPCSIKVEGLVGDNESTFGGANDDDNSGILRYVIIKHTGEEVSPGNELNGITFGAVGRATTVENLETYSTYDDGIEMFGGAVNFTNFVAVYVRDDSIDMDDGYIGTIDNALVIQSETQGNQCIESDGLADYGDDAAVDAQRIADGLNSAPTINNLTCIVSPSLERTQNPGAGVRFREGIRPTINDLVVLTSFGQNEDTADNHCLRIDNEPDTVVTINSAFYACETNAKDTEDTDPVSASSQFHPVPANTVVDASAAANPELVILSGAQKVLSPAWNTVVIDGGPADVATTPSSGDPADHVGGVSEGDVWYAGWSYGVDPANRGQALWFE